MYSSNIIKNLGLNICLGFSKFLSLYFINIMHLVKFINYLKIKYLCIINFYSIYNYRFYDKECIGLSGCVLFYFNLNVFICACVHNFDHNDCLDIYKPFEILSRRYRRQFFVILNNFPNN